MVQWYVGEERQLTPQVIRFEACQYEAMNIRLDFTLEMKNYLMDKSLRTCKVGGVQTPQIWGENLGLTHKTCDEETNGQTK